MKKNFFYALLFLLISGHAMAQTGFQPLNKGVRYKIITHGDGAKVKLNDVVSFHVSQKTAKDSILFSSYSIGHPVQVQVLASSNIGDLMDVFPLLAVGDSAEVHVPTDSIFIGHEAERPPFFAKGTDLIMVIKVVKTQSLNDAIAERNAALEKLKTDEKVIGDKYIVDHKLSFITTASGLKYHINVPSIKRKPVAGDTVEVNYIGRTLDGKVFDTSIESEAKSAGTYQMGRPYEPIKFPVGRSAVIPGWDEGLLLLNEGSKATLFIPSALAYADKGAGADIKPFSTLLFDVELVKVIPAKVKAKPAAKTTAKPGAKKAATGAKKPVAKKAATATTKK